MGKPNQDNNQSLDRNKITGVQVDGVALLKIIKHAHENTNELAAGQLLGLDVGDTLEITNCFPIPVSDENDNGNIESYKEEMMDKLNEINIDNNTVGWYQISYMENYLNLDVIASQLNFQNDIASRCVCLVYDPSRTIHGGISLKAFRLSDKFAELFKENEELGREAFVGAGVTTEDLFVEVPVTFKNNKLSQALLLQLGESLNLDKDMDALSLSTSPYIEEHLDSMVNCADDLGNENNRYFYYLKALQRQQSYVQKKKDMGEEEDLANIKSVQEPSRLQGYLIANQLNTYASNINQYVEDNSTKLFVAEHFHAKSKQQE
eukprot:gb/GECH01012890.1/.p1 GENE.gb/GECH01012890.1/~~gb/GECH01012890.1/.p1  ORF type:complete len:320 (+),score=92.27 gb/GECH01012890.1/:1-960(+)